MRKYLRIYPILLTQKRSVQLMMTGCFYFYSTSIVPPPLLTPPPPLLTLPILPGYVTSSLELVVTTPSLIKLLLDHVR